MCFKIEVQVQSEDVGVNVLECSEVVVFEYSVIRLWYDVKHHHHMPATRSTYHLGFGRGVCHVGAAENSRRIQPRKARGRLLGFWNHITDCILQYRIAVQRQVALMAFQDICHVLTPNRRLAV